MSSLKGQRDALFLPAALITLFNMEKALFVSDLHFGANAPSAIPQREKHFCDFLREEAIRASHLFILGDLFEFWMEYKYYIPKEHFQVLSALNQAAQQGVEIHYLAGNHDFNLGSFFKQHLNIHQHQNEFIVNLQGKNLYLHHGDGMAKTDWKYRIMKRIIRHPFSNFAFKLIHPDGGMALAKWVGHTSRQVPRENKKPEYKEKALSLLQDFDVVMHGHTHWSFLEEHPNGLHINIGDWFFNMHYVEMSAGKFEIKKYLPQSPQ